MRKKLFFPNKLYFSIMKVINMKAIVCSMMLLPSLLWAEVGSSSPNYKPDSDFVSTSNTPTEEEADSPYSPEEPEVPESISKRAKEDNGLLQQRENRETATVNNPFVLTPHKPNYFLPIAYTSNPNDRAFLGDASDSESLQSVEFKFQFSLK